MVVVQMEVIRLDRGELLVRHREGDSTAFAELVDYYRKPVFTYICRSGLPSAVRDDVFQEIFINIHNGAGTFDAEKPLNPWIFRIVCNTVHSHLRKDRVRKLMEPDGFAERLPVQESSSGLLETGILNTRTEANSGADYAVEAKETARWLDSQIQDLSQQQREVVLLCCLKNLSQADVAQALELPLNTVKTVLRRARIELANRLSRRNQALRREAMS